MQGSLHQLCNRAVQSWLSTLGVFLGHNSPGHVVAVGCTEVGFGVEVIGVDVVNMEGDSVFEEVFVGEDFLLVDEDCIVVHLVEVGCIVVH